jgi:hypothetical protein
VIVYGDYVKMCENFGPNFGENITGCCITTMHSFTPHFPPGYFFYKKQHNAIPHPPYSSMFSQLKLKLKGRHFHTIEVIGAESHVVLNTLTEHNFQDAKMADALGTAYTLCEMTFGRQSFESLSA